MVRLFQLWHAVCYRVLLRWLVLCTGMLPAPQHKLSGKLASVFLSTAHPHPHTCEPTVAGCNGYLHTKEHKIASTTQI